MTTPDPRIAIGDGPCDVEETKQSFGTRWRQEAMTLTAKHLAALQAGKMVAVDVQSEYILFLRLQAEARMKIGRAHV